MKVDLLTIPYTSIFLDVGIIDCFSRLSFIPIERLFPNTSIWLKPLNDFVMMGFIEWIRYPFLKFCLVDARLWFLIDSYRKMHRLWITTMRILKMRKQYRYLCRGKANFFFFLRENIFVEKKRGLTRKTLDFIILHLARKLLLKKIRNYISKLFGLFLKKFRRVQISFQNANSNPLPL